MKLYFFLVSLTFLSCINPLDCKEVMNDFGKKFNYKQFNKNVILIRENYQDKVFDSIVIISKELKKEAWAKINSAIRKCDYIVTKDSNFVNCFFIYSDKAYQKFWVKYNSNNQIAIIKFIKPDVPLRLIPPPCGY